MRKKGKDKRWGSRKEGARVGSKERIDALKKMSYLQFTPVLRGASISLINLQSGLYGDELHIRQAAVADTRRTWNYAAAMILSGRLLRTDTLKAFLKLTPTLI